ncbi:hypothetical protein O2V63_20175 [Modestobacter sp. VKM Ac-2977]|uniref:MAB_1171c family putative transporter n=1 Tax=Modestobacter sp. VKM Ac-2977 TaxID=3004131 RepID=UPI0022AAB058|nr:MAB_1171c family putative transporter [Modestobacter sp. VKM Ac-2977]MCZ2822661.1 hypothetical protein [Modestobacter sp. VKM Ac-2977]
MIYAAVALLRIATAARARSFGQAPSFINGTYALAAAAVAAGVSIKATEQAIDHVTGPYVSDLLEHGLIVVAGVAAQLFLLALRTGRPSRGQTGIRVAVAGLVLALMVVAFLAAPVHDRYVGDLDEAYGMLGQIAVYRLVFNSYLVYVLADIVRLCHRYAFTPADRGIAVSLALVGWGSAICLGYPLSRLLYTLIASVSAADPAVIQLRGSAAAVVGLCVLAVGVLTPRALTAARRWVTAMAGIQRLDPLWRDLTGSFPLVALPTSAPTTVRRAELRYDRHLLEIADALVHARVHAPPDGDLDPVTATAQALAADRGRWRSGDEEPGGCIAAGLLPTVASTAQEREHLLALAEAYRAARTGCARQPQEAG